MSTKLLMARGYLALFQFPGTTGGMTIERGVEPSEDGNGEQKNIFELARQKKTSIRRHGAPSTLPITPVSTTPTYILSAYFTIA